MRAVKLVYLSRRWPLLGPPVRPCGRLVPRHLREIIRFDATGTTTLLELSRDADRRGVSLEIVDKADRPQYVATGLATRIKFLSGKSLEALER